MSDPGMSEFVPGQSGEGAQHAVAGHPGRPTRLWWWKAEEGPDAGSPKARLVALVALIVLVATVVILNQFGDAPPAAEQASAQTPEGTSAGETVPLPQPPVEGDQFVIAMKMLVRMAHVLDTGPNSQGGAALAPQVDANTQGDRQRFWGAIVAAELAGAEAGLSRLETLTKQIESRGSPVEGIEGDIAIARAIYEGQTSEIDKATLDDFYVRQGWFGDLARVYGVDADDPAKAPLVKGGLRLILGVVLIVIVALVAIVGALVGAISMLVAYSSGKIRTAFVPPAVGGSVWLETAAVFVASFLLLKIVSTVLVILVTPAGGAAPAWATSAPLLLQWFVLLSVFWPLLRGVTMTEWKRQVGWHAGLGFWREVGAGIWGYFAGLPVLAMAMVFTLVVVMLKGAMAGGAEGEAPTTPSNPIVDILSTAGPLQIAMLFLLATVWAPLTEELIFRGGLFRHVRTRLGVFLAAPLTAIVFGVMHGYDAMLLMPVITIGFVFAFIREWRGSLIGPIVAHGLHNATILSIVILFLGGVM
jgi:membrane protease YdiL (CAAX protease family)